MGVEGYRTDVGIITRQGLVPYRGIALASIQKIGESTRIEVVLVDRVSLLSFLIVQFALDGCPVTINRMSVFRTDNIGKAIAVLNRRATTEPATKRGTFLASHNGTHVEAVNDVDSALPQHAHANETGCIGSCSSDCCFIAYVFQGNRAIAIRTADDGAYKFITGNGTVFINNEVLDIGSVAHYSEQTHFALIGSVDSQIANEVAASVERARILALIVTDRREGYS